jgi:hypothetical protein
MEVMGGDRICLLVRGGSGTRAHVIMTQHINNNLFNVLP